MTALNGVSNPVQWDIRPAETPGIFKYGMYSLGSLLACSVLFDRLFVPNEEAPLAMDLTEGRADNNTPIVLYPPHSGKNQSWRFVEGE